MFSKAKLLQNIRCNMLRNFRSVLLFIYNIKLNYRSPPPKKKKPNPLHLFKYNSLCLKAFNCWLCYYGCCLPCLFSIPFLPFHNKSFLFVSMWHIYMNQSKMCLAIVCRPRTQGSKGIRQWPINLCTSTMMIHKITSYEY